MPKADRSYRFRALATSAVAILFAATSTASGVAASDDVETTLLDAGAEPRTSLRFAIHDGASTDYVILGERSDRLTHEDEPGSWEETTASTQGRRSVVGIDENGRYSIEDVTYADASAASDPVTHEDLVRRWEMDDRGRIWYGEGVNPDGPASLALPLEPVGIGARWSTVGPVSWPPGAASPLFQGSVTTTTTLTDVHEDGRFELVGSFELTARDVPVPATALPEGVTSADYDEVHLVGGYHWIVDPTDPLVVTEGRIDGYTTVTVTGGGRSSATTRESIVELRMEPVEGPDGALVE